jgi:hypothetical protein
LQSHPDYQAFIKTGFMSNVRLDEEPNLIETLSLAPKTMFFSPDMLVLPSKKTMTAFETIYLPPETVLLSTETS